MNTVIRVWILSIFSLIVVCLGSVAHAAVYFGGDEYSLSEKEVVTGNMYVGAGNIVILGTVTGDLSSAGGKVLVQGSTGSDIAAAGGNVDILGPTGGDVRVSGGQIVIGNKIGGDVIAFGGTVHILEGAQINGDIIIAGGRIVIDGTVRGKADIYGSEVVFNGRVDGSVKVQATKTFIFGEDAAIMGSLEYHAPEAVPSIDEKVTGTVSFTPGFDERAIRAGLTGAVAAALGLFFLVTFFGVMLVAVIVTVFWGESLSRGVERGAAQIGKNILIGFAFLVAVPVAVVLLITTLIGIVPALVIISGYIFILFASKIFSGILAGALMYQWWRGNIRVSGTLAVIGTAALAVAGLIPFVGPIVTFLFFLAALGIIVRELYIHLPHRQTSAEIPS